MYFIPFAFNPCILLLLTGIRIFILFQLENLHLVFRHQVGSNTQVHAHDASDECREGDVVRIVETRPVSKTKNWKVVEVVTRAQQ